MTSFHVIAGNSASPAYPLIRKIGLTDLNQALTKGFDDFRAMPSHLAFLCIVYVVIGIALYPLTTVGGNVLPLLFPLLSGFALIGPFAAIGLYEVSRRRELGLPYSWPYAFDVLRSPAIPSILAVGLLLMAIFLLWLASAQSLYERLFGDMPPKSLPAFLTEVTTTPEGRTLMILGCAIGFVFALTTLSVSVVSFPLLLDRDVGAAVAVHTSVRTMFLNPVMMALWGLIVAVALAFGMLTLFVGLVVVIPILGHSTWHLYRRIVAPAADQR
ncbi:MAG: DUF2189 domain-containing protein [Methylocella sp.]